MSSNVQNATKREHYVPQFYLANFSTPEEHGTVYSLEVTAISPCPKKMAVSRLCYCDDLYESKYDDKYILHNETEHSFSKSETWQKALVDKIINISNNSANINSALVLRKSEKEKLFQFIAQLYLRNKSIYQQMYNSLKCQSDGSGNEGKRFMDSFLKQAYNRTIISTSDGEYKEFQTKYICEYLNTLRYQFCYTKEIFITSNVPVAVFSVADEDVQEIWVPLAPHVGILFSSRSGLSVNNRLIDHTHSTEKLNRRMYLAPIATHSDSVLLIASEDKILQEIYQNTSIEPQKLKTSN